MTSINDADAGKIMKVVFGSVGSGPNDVFPVIAEEIAVSVYYLEIVYSKTSNNGPSKSGQPLYNGWLTCPN